MYPKRGVRVFGLLFILSCSGVLSEDLTRTRRTTKPSSTTNSAEIEKDNRLHHQQQTTSTLISSQYQPDNPFLYPSQRPTAPPYAPQNPVHYPPPQYYPPPPTRPPYQPTTVPPTYYHPPHTQPHYSPTPTPGPTPPQQGVIDQFDYRYPDGSYEFRYELPDETVRYERGYLIRYHHKSILVVRGYYSYRLPDKRYLTVFYTADQNGYRQNSSNFSYQRPQLPRSIQVDSTLTRDGLDSSEVEDTTVDEDRA